MFSLSFEQRKLPPLLEQHFRFVLNVILNGELHHRGRGPPYLYELFIEVCSIMLFIGDVRGYIVLDDNDVVDPIRSYTPFLERFVRCLEMTHMWCVRNPPDYIVGFLGKWDTCGSNPRVLVSKWRALRTRMEKAVYPHVTQGTVVPCGESQISDFQLRELFCQTSRSVIDLVQQCPYHCRPLRFSLSVRSVKVYMRSQCLEKLSGGTSPTALKAADQHRGDVVSVRLTPCNGYSRGRLERKSDLYLSLTARESFQTLYGGLKLMLQSQEY